MVLICISLVISSAENLHVPVGHLYIFFGEMPTEDKKTNLETSLLLQLTCILNTACPD